MKNLLILSTTKDKFSSQATAINSKSIQLFSHIPRNAIEENDDDTVAYNNKVAGLQALQAR